MKKIICFMIGQFFLSFIMAQAQAPDFLTPKEVEVYNQHSEEAIEFANISVGELMTEMNAKHFMTAECKKALRKILEERELRLAITNFIYFDDSLRYSTKLMIRGEYDDPILRTLLYAGTSASTNNYSLLLSRKNSLSLTQDQFGQIVERAVDLNRQMRSNSKLDVWPHELITLNTVLSEEQLDKFFKIINAKEIYNDLQKTWSVLKENLATNDLDSINEFSKMYKYYHLRYKASALNYKKEDLKRLAFNTIDQRAPLSVQRYKSIITNKKLKKSYNGTYTW